MNIEAAQPATPLAFIALRIHTALIAPCPQEMLLNGSCQCFLILSVDFFPLNPHITTTTANVTCCVLFVFCHRDFFCPRVRLFVEAIFWAHWGKKGGLCLHWRPCWKPKGTVAMMRRLIKDLFFPPCFIREGRKRCRDANSKKEKEERKKKKVRRHAGQELHSDHLWTNSVLCGFSFFTLCSSTWTHTHLHRQTHMRTRPCAATRRRRRLSWGSSQRARLRRKEKTLIPPSDYIVLQIFKPYA